MFVPIRDAVIITRAKPATVRKWAERGRIVTACDLRTRHVMYEIASLIEIEAVTRERRVVG